MIVSPTESKRVIRKMVKAAGRTGTITRISPRVYAVAEAKVLAYYRYIVESHPSGFRTLKP